MCRQDKPLKELYPLPAANEAAVRLMYANIQSIGRLMELSLDQLKNTPRIEPHLPILHKLLKRISQDPHVARPLKKSPFE